MSVAFPSFQAVVDALFAISAGLVVGLVYFRALRAAVGLLIQGRGWMLPLGLSLARLAGVVGVLSLAVQFGAVTLIACFLGFLLARTIALRSAPEVR